MPPSQQYHTLTGTFRELWKQWDMGVFLGDWPDGVLFPSQHKQEETRAKALQYLENGLMLLTLANSYNEHPSSPSQHTK